MLGIECNQESDGRDELYDIFCKRSSTKRI